MRKPLLIGLIARPVVDPDTCAGCGLCEQVCPVDPAAIYINPA